MAENSTMIPSEMNTLFTIYPVIHLIWTSITLVSTVLYIGVIIRLILNRRKDPFDSSYFTLWTAIGITDVVAVVHSTVFIKWQENPRLPQVD